MNLNTIGKRIGFGYAIIGAIMAGGLFVMHILTGDLVNISRMAGEVRSPTAETAAKILVGIADIQPTLRFWINNRDQGSLATVHKDWREKIEPSVEKLAALSPQWIRSENKVAFDEFRSRVDAFRSSILRLEAMTDQEAALNEFKQTFSPLADYLRQRMEVLIQNQSKDLESDLSFQEDKLALVEWMRAAMIVMVIVISIVAGFILSRSVGRPLSRAMELADLVAGGNFSTQIEVTGTEELSRLGSALERMRSNLERQNWLQQSQIQFHEAIRGTANLRELADAVTSTLANSVQAAVGAFYTAENGALKVLGGFALPQKFAVETEIPFGEGIAGQAAMDKRLVTVAEKNTGSLELSTMLGNIKPREVLATPLIFRDELVGVLELASVSKFGAREREFMTMASQAAAVALNSTQKAEQVRNLLAETQTQAEELQSQQEELRNANEELQTRQEELESSNEELEEQKSLLEAQKQALDEKNESLDRVSQYKSEFLANMSHELRTPLNSQLILSALLAENKEGNLSQKQLEFVSTINASGQNLLQLINDILDLSKVEAGKLLMDVQDVDLQELVEGLSRDFKSPIEQKGLKLITKIDSALPPMIQTDSLRLGQVLRNLLSNALKFTETGEIALHVEPMEGEMVAFRVVDTGIGIPADKVDSIFEAFEQVDSSTSRKYGGTGLGLAISKGLAELLGGGIRLTSRFGEGSVFTLTVPYSLKAHGSGHPRAGKKQSLPSHSSVRAAARGQKNSILIFEDDARFADVLAELAKEKGFNPILARDGAHSVELAQTHLPACILLDYNLPGADGLQVLKKLKADPRTRHIPVHMISDDDHGREANQLGAVGYLLKPASPEKLGQVMSKLQKMVQKEIRRVLVVDDEAVQREHIIKVIANDSVIANGVPTAEEAFHALTQEGPFDCIVLDLGLPGQSGLDLLKKIRADKSIALPPVVIHTAKDLTREEEESLRHYSDSIIIKGAKSSERLLDEVSLFIHRVTLELPQKERKLLEEINQQELSLSGKKVLLVDDDIRNVFALSSAMEQKGIDVVVARNGEEALEALKTNPLIHLVLMDIMMPIMDGHEAMRRIRKDPRHSKLPIIALTAKAMKGDKEACLEAGASDYLSKPIELKQFFTLMRVWLSK